MELRLDCICIWMLGVGFARALELHLDGVAVADAVGGVAFGCICIWSSDAFGLQCHPRASTHLIGSRSGVPMHGRAVRAFSGNAFRKGGFFPGMRERGCILWGVI